MSYEYPPPQVSSSSQNSTLAIVSLIMGILGLTFLPTIGSIVAVITGYMAQKEIRQSSGSLSGQGLATAGLVMGWIGIALSLVGICIACLIFALIPLGILSADQFSMVLPAVFSAL